MWWAFRVACVVIALASAYWWWPALRALPRALAARRWRAGAATLVAIGAVVALLLQAIPLGWDHSNPPVLGEPAWDSPATRGLAVRACFDCHSNESTWPWYSNVAPVSWLVANDVRSGRDELNLSEWVRARQDDAREAAEAVEEREMPPLSYLLTHPEARLTAQERAALAAGLRASLGTSDRPRRSN